MNKKIFITGIAGFIGFHAARHLVKRGDQVFGIDNFNSYYDPHLKHARANILAKEGIEIKNIDIQDFLSLKELVEKESPTHILHLAAQAGVRYSLINPQSYLKTNIDGFLNILEVCRLHTHIPLIYASSSSVYGLNKQAPFAVADKTDAQASLYGVTKKTNELMAQTYHHLFGIKTTGLRFFTVYGPWGRPDMAYFSFARSILEGSPIDVYNHGKMERDFTFIDDIVSGTVAALDLSLPYGLFNLGNHRPEKLLDLIALLEKELGKKANKNFLPMQDGDVVSTHAHIEESQKTLGYSPKVSLEEGISQFVTWYKDFF